MIERGSRKFVINGRVMPNLPGTAIRETAWSAEEDKAILSYLEPLLDSAVLEIIRETEALRASGKLAPFVEGEHIGVLPRLVRRRPPTELQLRKAHNVRMEERRDAMLRLRRGNDTTIKELLAWRSSATFTSPATPPSAAI